MPKSQENYAEEKVIETVVNDEMEEDEEEVEYEEVEEEVEEELDEEVEEEKVHGSSEARANGDESQRHVELLALPPHGAEMYVGNITSDVSEEDLRSLCKSVGEVVEVRVMKSKNSSENKGFAFVSFRTKEQATKAIEELNRTELKGNKIKCSASQAKHRLFVGNVPREWGESDLLDCVKGAGPGIVKVELLKDPKNTDLNRGFAFVEFYNNACAEYSRQKMSNPTFKLGKNAPTISWADPKSADSSSSQVKAIYVKNLPKNVTQEEVRHLFERHGEISKIVLPPSKPGQERRFGFVHFARRASAMRALQNTEKYELDGQELGCSLAKPQADKKPDNEANAQRAALLPPYSGGYGLPSYGSYAPGFAQPMVYGKGATSAGMAMVPMILPDGRPCYVLQQPGLSSAPARGRSSISGGGSRNSSVKQESDAGRGRRYKPY